ncbi:MAG: universal stress protein, partial [Candidatus Obscuribacterales bacterium]|nr:universal stress protein [Candidatus Obscuribacterales bacterium]
MRVLVGLDGSPSSLAALESLSARAWPTDTQVKLVTVVPPPETNFLGLSLAHSYREEKQEMESAERMLTSHAQFYQRKLQNVSVGVEVLTGRPKETLLQAAEDWKPDLFILGSRGQRDFDPLM